MYEVCVGARERERKSEGANVNKNKRKREVISKVEVGKVSVLIPEIQAS